MKPISQNRKPRSVFRIDPPSCALPQKKFLSLASRSVPTAIIFYFHHRLQAILLFSHHAHAPSPTSCHLSTLLKTHSYRIPSHPGRLPSSRCIKSDRPRF
jgi:hypothetical protein